ncbi:FAD-dependent monooxygenase [Actinokineospora bangkokensis]|uniref:FAD-binding domain-containing protein n=1 Tax=Actinokineospora bangkokensis TaxID=1193682 RepID=A0A1Q9LKG8_9PSEU|nr:FAD-dependent monooxygenase [Actinokineospora bangkokensis]OLR92494.1 hypothetical protein BJP25_20710 [Actinokineospora bangkokensis]
MGKRVLISGMGIAGPALAHWLGRAGHEVTVVERAPGPRTTGAAVDFRGDQVALLHRMGVHGALHARRTGMGDLVVVDRAGRERARVPAALFSGELEVERADLAEVLAARCAPVSTPVFGDRATALRQDPGGVEVEFERGPAARYDLVVGADGQHSGVRALAFGPEERYRHDLGHLTATYGVPNTFGLERAGVIHNAPGRYANVSSCRDPRTATVSLVFASTARPGRDPGAQRALITERYADLGWRVPELLAGLASADDLYFAPITQLRLPAWSTGRVVLLGDAAWGAGPGGNGSGHALLGAYVLAGELEASGWDVPRALARYEAALRPAVERSQRQAASMPGFLVPPTAARIALRNASYRVLGSKPMTALFERLSARTANTGALPEYPLPVTA